MATNNTMAFLQNDPVLTAQPVSQPAPLQFNPSSGAGYQAAAERLFQQLRDLNSYSEITRKGQLASLDNVGSQFKTLFKNLVGRDATADELDTFYSQAGGDAIYSAPLGRAADDTMNIRNKIASYVNDTYQGAAQDFATQQLRNQQVEANSLAELFRTQGRQAISETESKLMDYQQRLFERLRPNLMTSLQAQGLLNTGALNESMAGAMQDLGTAAQGTLLDMNYQNEQGANAIAYGGASAPYMFDQQNIMNRPSMLQQSGADALNKAFQTYTQNLQFQQQSALLNQQARLNKGSFLNSLGQGIAGGIGSGLGNFIGNTGMRSGNNTYTGLASLWG